MQLCSRLSSMLLFMSRYNVLMYLKGMWKVVDSWDQGRLSVTFSVG